MTFWDSCFVKIILDVVWRIDYGRARSSSMRRTIVKLLEQDEEMMLESLGWRSDSGNRSGHIWRLHRKQNWKNCDTCGMRQEKDQFKGKNWVSGFAQLDGGWWCQSLIRKILEEHQVWQGGHEFSFGFVECEVFMRHPSGEAKNITGLKKSRAQGWWHKFDTAGW